jgi:hypothetical protein
MLFNRALEEGTARTYAQFPTWDFREGWAARLLRPRLLMIHLVGVKKQEKTTGNVWFRLTRGLRSP